MIVNSNICAPCGLSPSISLTFRRSSGSCKPSFYRRSFVLLTAAEHLHYVCVLVEELECFWPAHMEMKVSVLKLALVCGSGLLHCSWRAVRWEQWSWNDCTWHSCWFCHINDLCQKGCTGEQVLLAARASQSLLNKPPTSHMVALLRGKPSVALPSLCCLVLAGVFCLRNALLYPVQRNGGCFLPVFGISANLSLLIVICARKYQGKPPFNVTLRENYQNQKSKQNYFIPLFCYNLCFSFSSANCPVLLQRRKN